MYLYIPGRQLRKRRDTMQFHLVCFATKHVSAMHAIQGNILWFRRSFLSCWRIAETQSFCCALAGLHGFCNDPTPPRNQHVTGSSFSNLSGTALYREALSKGMEILGEEQTGWFLCHAPCSACLAAVGHIQVGFHSCCAGARWGAIPIWFQQWHSCSVHCDGVSLKGGENQVLKRPEIDEHFMNAT